MGRGGRDVRLGKYDRVDEGLYTALMSGLKSEMTSSCDQDWVGVTYFVNHPQ